jgi:lipoprotein NlpD
MRIIAVILVSLLLTACNNGWFDDFRSIEPIPKSGIHRVVHGETLYAIAYRYNLNLKSLARHNSLVPPYYIYTGELIYLRGYAPRAVQMMQRQLAKPQPAKSSSTKPDPIAPVSFWEWPAHGRIIGPFCALNKGINISGQLGDPVYASAAGKVIYSGKGLRTYGNLIIIKHNNQFLTAYAHNEKNMVQEGDWVKPGQQIAEMGDTGTQRVMLHYEIRRSGEPVNPLNYLGHA